MQCRFIDTGFKNAFENMAIDEAILHYCKIPTLRVYGWKPAAISIGYNQDIENEINADYCKKSNIEIVRRITGGKAVFHDKEITYSFILPEDANLVPFEVNESYRIIANALVIALKKIGIDADIKKAPDKIKTPICFNSANWYELLANGRKISGSAQRRFNGKILQHGPILIDFDYEKNASLFNSNNSFDNILNLKNRITSIKNELRTKNNNKKVITYEELAEAIKDGFKGNFNLKIINSPLNNEETQLAWKLTEEKYSTEEWNYRVISKYI
ncbi:MAG: biotin/lipoate A/B protein ligase family protein [Nanoarchaeota archaeon]